MHSDSSEPSEGAALPVSRAVSTAEKRAEYARLGLEWPKYPDGTDQLWKRDEAKRVGGRWASWPTAVKKREKSALLNAVHSKMPGICGTKGCTNPKYRTPAGTYHVQCSDHARQAKTKHNRKSLGWYDNGGMATKPTQFKELTNE